MASYFPRPSFVAIVVVFVLPLMMPGITTRPVLAIFRPSPWKIAHATFYGDETASETMGM